MKNTEDYNEGLYFGIRICNAELQELLNNAYREFNKLKRINKADMVRIFANLSGESLGDEVNPCMEDAEPTRTTQNI